MKAKASSTTRASPCLCGPRFTTSTYPAPKTVSSLKAWFELDINPGFIFTFAKNWSFTISDYIYTSPGDYFDASHNLSLAFEYDDSDVLGAFALHPYFYFQQELTNHAGLAFKDGVPFASDAPEGQYYEFGIGPATHLGKNRPIR